ncbi:BrnA antitoxin family protein [Zooshikella sp. RANM57]|uniref:BrnA antitoxin family protein n=1 Tax=Zooshikella sp. RANM57 TaxID=3425863 RepID=UPI003D6E953F
MSKKNTDSNQARKKDKKSIDSEIVEFDGSPFDPLTPEQIEELRALAAKPDSEIDTSDIPPITDWSNAEHGKFYRPIKEKVSLRLDSDIIKWFKDHHDRYQTGINKALREYIDSHRAQ